MPAKVIVDFFNGKGSINKAGKNFARLIMEKNARLRLKLFDVYIKGKRVLDVGLGVGSMANILKIKGFAVQGIDVVNTSLYPNVSPVIYNGEDIPMGDDSFDTGMLICVLHHCSNPLKVLEETMRVCKRIIIIEDTFRNNFEKWLVSMRDSVGNFEFYQHEYHTTKEWLEIFWKRGWKSLMIREWSSVEFYGMYGRQTLFVIERR